MTDTNKDKKSLIQEALDQITTHKIIVKGKETSLKNLVSEDDLWVQGSKKRKMVIISHEAVERLAKAGNVKILEPKLLISPVASNEQQHVFLITPVMENGNLVYPQIGEASTRNLGGFSKGYPATMAYKRGFDRAILRALGIEGVYSDSEAEEFASEEIRAKVTNQELAALKVELSTINKETNRAKLLSILDEAFKKDLSDAQKAYLFKVFRNKYEEIAFGDKNEDQK